MEFELLVDALSYGPQGVGRAPDGRTVFAAGVAPGDVVRVSVEEDKGTFLTARVVELVQAGPSRVAAACPLAGACGGCAWGHVAYEEQLESKRRNTVESLVRIGHLPRERAESLVEPCAPSKRHMGYRNKIELAATRDAQGRLTLGFMREGSADVVPVDACPLAHKVASGAPKALQGALRFLEKQDDLGIFRVGVRTSVRTKQTEVAIWTRPGAFPRSAAAKTIQSAIKATSIVRVMADPGRARAVKGVEVLSGAGYWREQLGDFEFKVSAPSFFQVNTAQAEVLVETVLAALEVDESTRVADLYSGVGTFTLPLADVSDDVVAVESAASSVRDLRRNAEEAGVWVEVLGGDSARELPAMGELDALVVDPPRSGLAKGVAESISAAGPERVAYVSCNPSTWARDVARMRACGYELLRVRPVDLFPQTYHNEVVSVFARS